LARVINFTKHQEDIAYERGAKVFHNITKADVERWASKRQ
jgi:ATP:cob(I)alamin adenosyltransferase, putative